MIKGLIAAGLLIFSSMAWAETKTYNVQGMHCEGCVSSVKEKVCGLEGIAKCDVEVGKVTLTTKEGAKLDDNAVTNAVEAAGYKVTNEPMNSKMVAKGKMSCEHHDAKTCGETGCGCNKDGKTCQCDHEKGGCHCDHQKGGKAKKKGA